MERRDEYYLTMGQWMKLSDCKAKLDPDFRDMTPVVP
jgi:hypothetical protein